MIPRKDYLNRLKIAIGRSPVTALLGLRQGGFSTLARQMAEEQAPLFSNLGKRRVKSPKIYFRDSGLLHSLLDLPDKHSLLGHPKVGASWEGFAIEQALQILHPNAVYFWGECVFIRTLR